MLSRAYWLWVKAKQGEAAACEELLRLHYEPIYCYLRRLSGGADEAQDLTQETFIKVWQALPKQRRFKDFRAWIYRIARNTWLNSIRGAKRTELRSEVWWESLADPGGREKAGLAEREMAEIVWQKVQELDVEKKETIILRYYQELSLRETAAVLKVATSTVKYRLRQALKLLQEQLAKETEQSECSTSQFEEEAWCDENQP